jgi:hypothetical protein
MIGRGEDLRYCPFFDPRHSPLIETALTPIQTVFFKPSMTAGREFSTGMDMPPAPVQSSCLIGRQLEGLMFETRFHPRPASLAVSSHRLSIKTKKLYARTSQPSLEYIPPERVLLGTHSKMHEPGFQPKVIYE